jgi:hypothetical protein
MQSSNLINPVTVMPHPTLTSNPKSASDSQDVDILISSDDRYWTVRGSDGDIVVDIEKAREAMRYAMRQHAKARQKRERLEES